MPSLTTPLSPATQRVWHLDVPLTYPAQPLGRQLTIALATPTPLVLSSDACPDLVVACAGGIPVWAAEVTRAGPPPSDAPWRSRLRLRPEAARVGGEVDGFEHASRTEDVSRGTSLKHEFIHLSLHVLQTREQAIGTLIEAIKLLLGLLLVWGLLSKLSVDLCKQFVDQLDFRGLSCLAFRLFRNFHSGRIVLAREEKLEEILLERALRGIS